MQLLVDSCFHLCEGNRFEKLFLMKYKVNFKYRIYLFIFYFSGSSLLGFTRLGDIFLFFPCCMLLSPPHPVLKCLQLASYKDIVLKSTEVVCNELTEVRCFAC